MSTLRALFTVCCTALATATLPAAAASLKPGLWEMTSKVASASPETMSALALAQKEMANMSAEQRRTIEQALANQGVKMDLGATGGVKVNFCLTPEQAADPTFPAGQPGQCSSTRTKVPGGMNVSFKCDKPRSSGSGQVIFEGDSGFTMRMNVDSTVQGQSQQMTVESAGRWLKRDCGSVQPVR